MTLGQNSPVHRIAVTVAAAERQILANLDMIDVFRDDLPARVRFRNTLTKAVTGLLEEVSRNLLAQRADGEQTRRGRELARQRGETGLL